MRPSTLTNSVLTALALAGLTTSAVAGSAQPVVATELLVPVQGLEAEHAQTIERALEALESEQDPPRKLLDEVTVELEEERLTLRIAAGQELALSQLQRALAKGEARVDPAGLRIRTARLVVRVAPDGEDRSDALERVLRAKAAFSEVRVERDVEASLYRAAVRGGSERATLTGVRKAIESAVEGSSLADVVWSAPKA